MGSKQKGCSVDMKGRKESKKRRRGEANKRWRERKRIERERRKSGEKKREFFPAFRRLNLDGSRVKVDPRNEGYVWVPKSWSFAKLQEVGNFPTCIIF